ncbi:MAG: metal-dependent hydrolase [Chthoniobacterales bacterium]|nr:metal-dependent hydrolase [Chthoniobacterales bacterium]
MSADGAAAADLAGPLAAVGLYLFLATVSHCVLDAFTDGELGVAFFAPFENSRYFFPVTPIAVSPIGGSFFSARGLSVVLNEVVWIWVPFSALRGCVLATPADVLRPGGNGSLRFAPG